MPEGPFLIRTLAEVRASHAELAAHLADVDVVLADDAPVAES